MTGRSLQQHINGDRDELHNSNTSGQRRCHLEDELGHLEKYQNNHSDTNHDPSGFEMYCDENPNALECRLYDS
jgi:hypothetical protein